MSIELKIAAVIPIEVNKPVLDLLEQLLETGLYGITIEEVALRILCRELERQVKDGP